MDLNFIDLYVASKKAKATIHVTGKLGLSNASVSLMNITETDRLFKVATEPTHKDILYLVPDSSGMNSIKASRAGQYYYFNLARVFDDLAYDYKNYIISFRIEPVQWDSATIFKLTVNSKSKR